MLHCSCKFCWTGYDDTNCNWKKRKLPIYVGELAFSVLGKAARFWAFAPEVQFCSSDFLSLFDVHAFGFFYLLRGASALWRRTQKAWRGWHLQSSLACSLQQHIHDCVQDSQFGRTPNAREKEVLKAQAGLVAAHLKTKTLTVDVSQSKARSGVDMFPTWARSSRMCMVRPER